MNEREKAALKVIQLLNKRETLDDRYLTRVSDEERQERREALKEALAVLGDDIIVNNQWNQEKSERVKTKWACRLEYYKKHGNVEGAL
ncbi:hypothetical protein IKG20_01070 [Candidatus Saccharibacteria bacterium]|nr:hypothetical protein [Candidatus Saccharibacteria bacterium]